MVAEVQVRRARLLMLGAAICGLGGAGMVGARAQLVKAPRYGSKVDAPAPQLNLPPLPAAITPHGTVVEDVVVRVNDQIINRSDVERAQVQMAQESQQTGLSVTDQATREKDMLRDMIDQQLLLSRAKELGLNADADVIRKLDEIRKQNKMDSLEDLEKAATQQGVSFEDFKAQIRNQILTQEVVRDEVGRRLQVTQAEEAKYYEDHAKEFDQPEQIRLSEILVPLPETATDAQIAQAESKAKEIKAQEGAGADFAGLAKKYSGGPSAAGGGELGLFKRGALAKVLEDQTFELKPGQSTQPIRTRQGFVILKVTEHQAAGPAPMKAVEPQIQEAMYMQQMQPALRAYLTKLREESYIDLQPGFVDSGSSTRETKPVFTAYAPPPVKKKKLKQRARFERNGRGSYARKQDVVASPDTTGTRTLTAANERPAEGGAAAAAGSDGKIGVAEAKPGVDPATGLAILAPTKVASASARGGKAPKHQKREKIRFGQAPRNSLPAGTEEASVGTDAGGAVDTRTGARAAGGGAVAGAAGASEGSGASGMGASGLGAAVAPGAALSAEGASVSSSADLADNPLTPKEPVKAKTRFSARAKEEKDKKIKTVSAKQQEKISAKPVAMTTDEQLSAKTQAAPLGLAGDTTKKPKRAKRVKGTPKERLQDKPSKPKEVPAAVDQTASPALAPSAAVSDTVPAAAAETPAAVPNSSVPRAVPRGEDTTLPPVTAPVPGSPQQGQPVPGTQPPS